MAENLAGALAAVQASLPEVRKGLTAKVTPKDGKPGYSYQYADLADISKAVLPLLGANGLAWICRPTLTDDQRFVLAYELRHVSGEAISGEYPLPSGGSPQVLGSAITYGRRYSLCSVVGVAPDSDDDGAAATVHHGRPAEDAWETAQPQRPDRQRNQRPDEPGEHEPEVARPPTDAQVAKFDKFGQDILTAKRTVDIGRIGKSVTEARDSGRITKVQYDHLARMASERLAVLELQDGEAA